VSGEEIERSLYAGRYRIFDYLRDNPRRPLHTLEDLSRMKAIIVGAGFAGLTAGYKLRQAGWDVRVLEAASYAGGRSATLVENGYTVDTAATQITSGYKEYLALCKEVGLGGEIIRCSQIVGIVRDGRIHEVNAEKMLSAALSPVVSWSGKLAMARTYLEKRRIQPPLKYLELSDSYAHDDETARGYAFRRMNAESYQYLAAPLLRGNFLTCPDFASKLEWFGILDNFAGYEMLTVRGGTTRLPTELARKLDVRLNSPVTRVENAGDAVTISWLDHGVAKTERADACVVATRLPEAVRIDPAFAKLAGPLNEKLRYSRGLIAHLGFRRATNSKAIGLFLPQSEAPRFSLIWNEHNKNPHCAPPGHSLISCYFDDSCAEDLHAWSETALADSARSYLEALFPELKDQCDYTRISRWPLAIPFPQPGVHSEIHRLKQKLLPTQRVQYAGDYFSCTGQNTAIWYGKQAAERLTQSFAISAPRNAGTG
jgi:protoporphyrinogen/coproporphyrinogen III oxidase